VSSANACEAQSAARPAMTASLIDFILHSPIL
jgi:hypothetical protein